MLLSHIIIDPGAVIISAMRHEHIEILVSGYTSEIAPFYLEHLLECACIPVIDLSVLGYFYTIITVRRIILCRQQHIVAKNGRQDSNIPCASIRSIPFLRTFRSHGEYSRFVFFRIPFVKPESHEYVAFLVH